MKFVSKFIHASANNISFLTAGSCVLSALMYSVLSNEFSGTVFALLIIWPLFWALDVSHSYLSFLSKLWIFYSSVFLFIIFGLIAFIQNNFIASTPLAALAFVVLAFIHELPFVLVVSLVYPIGRFFKFTRVSNLLLVCFLIFATRKFAPRLFTMELSTALSAGSSEFKQLFSLFGIEGVEFLFLLLNVLIYLAIRQFLAGNRKQFATSLLLFILGISSLYLLSVHEQKQWVASEENLKLAYYQPGNVWPFDGDLRKRLDLELLDIESVDEILKVGSPGTELEFAL